MSTYAQKKAEALQAKNTVQITYDELERIKSMCSHTNEKQDYQTMRQSERDILHKKSVARISKWPNTAVAERERKEYERIKKLEDDEVSISIIVIIQIERRRVDAEEENYQQTLR